MATGSVRGVDRRDKQKLCEQGDHQRGPKKRIGGWSERYPYRLLIIAKMSCSTRARRWIKAWGMGRDVGRDIVEVWLWDWSSSPA